MMDFTGRCLLLTGASGGIAREAARIFHAAGADLVLTDLREPPLHELAAELGGERVAVLGMDAASTADCDAAVALCRDRCGGIDFLVPAAGIYPDQVVEGMTDAQWRQVMAVNLDGVFYLTRAAIPALRPNSAIVNLASLAAHRGSHGHAHYAAAKGALLSLTRSLALELGPKTRVNAVSPGIIDTPMISTLMAKRGPQILEQTALRRLGRADEIASVIAFLCSDAASFITGETIQANGGLYMS
jgi:3-oxoacyl-[acyl-carrier protein] reductase